jgi:hypothetical protein
MARSIAAQALLPRFRRAARTPVDARIAIPEPPVALPPGRIVHVPGRGEFFVRDTGVAGAGAAGTGAADAAPLGGPGTPRGGPGTTRARLTAGPRVRLCGAGPGAGPPEVGWPR